VGEVSAQWQVKQCHKFSQGGTGIVLIMNLLDRRGKVGTDTL